MLAESVVKNMTAMNDSFNELVKKVADAMKTIGDSMGDLDLSVLEDSDYEIDARLRKAYEHPE